MSCKISKSAGGLQRQSRLRHHRGFAAFIPPRQRCHHAARYFRCSRPLPSAAAFAFFRRCSSAHHASPFSPAMPAIATPLRCAPAVAKADKSCRDIADCARRGRRQQASLSTSASTQASQCRHRWHDVEAMRARAGTWISLFQRLPLPKARGKRLLWRVSEISSAACET